MPPRRSASLIHQSLTDEERAEVSRLETVIDAARRDRRNLFQRVASRLTSGRVKAARMAAE